MYANNRYEVTMLAATGESVVDCTSTGDVAVWGPGFVPHIVHAVGAVLNDTPGDTGTIKFDLRPTRASDTNRTDGTVGQIELLTTHTFTAGSAQPVIWDRPSSPVTVYPGQEVVAQVTASAAAVTAVRLVLWVEAVYATPGSVDELSTTTTMYEST